MDNQDLARSAFDSLEDGEAKALRLVRTMDERGEAINTLTIKREHPDPVPLDRIKPRGYILSDLRSFVRYCEHFIDDKNKAIVFAEGERFVLVEDPMAEFGMQGHYHAAYFNIKEHPYFISWHKNMNVFLKHEPLLEIFKLYCDDINPDDYKLLIQSYGAIKTTIGMERDSRLDDEQGRMYSVSFQSKSGGTEPGKLLKEFRINVPILIDDDPIKDSMEIKITIDIREPEKAEQNATFIFRSREMELILKDVKEKLNKDIEKQLGDFLVVRGVATLF